MYFLVDNFPCVALNLIQCELALCPVNWPNNDWLNYVVAYLNKVNVQRNKF